LDQFKVVRGLHGMTGALFDGSGARPILTLPSSTFTRDGMLHSFSGATIRRVVDRSSASVPAHAHDWPVLSIFVIGGYLNRIEGGEAFIAGPSAVLYRGGAVHQNVVGAAGFEQIEVEFDPAWLQHAIPDAPVSRWIGGRIGAEARTLARFCARATAETEVRGALQRFLGRAVSEREREVPRWIPRVSDRLREDAPPNANDLAAEAMRHPSWLGAAYKRATGEGLQEAAARFRIERAAQLLRETELPAAQVAAEAGFCDQSHMSRTFRRILGRLPSAVREDRRAFRQG
jgi:AraC family transcriptional regulator